MPRQLNGVRLIFSINGAGTIRSVTQNNEVGLFFFTTHIRINSKWFIGHQGGLVD